MIASLLLGYVCFPFETWGWLDFSQDHCASQSVGWGLGWTSLVLFFTFCPCGVGQYRSEEGLAVNAGLTGPGGEMRQANQFPGAVGLPALNTNLSSFQTTNAETQLRSFRYGW